MIYIVSGQGFLSYNASKGILGALSVEKQTSYHLFKINVDASNGNEMVKFSRKSKWYSSSQNINAMYDASRKLQLNIN